MYRAPDQVTDGNRDQTWDELTAYVSLGAMDSETAQQIYAASTTEDRKRTIAAHVADGSIKPTEAIRMLNIRESSS